MDEERFDAIIVGGGLAGIAAAYTLANAGKEVLLLEKGDYCGAKNVTGGRMYVAPIRNLFPDLWEKAPFERPITKEEIVLMDEAGSLQVSLDSDALRAEPYQSYSVCRAKFDKWFAKQAQRAGASVITKAKVEKLIIEKGQVVGVESAGDKLYANVVVCCDGVLSLLAQQAGLVKEPQNPEDFAVGFKEVIELPQHIIEDRFCVNEGSGAARLYMGDVTKGKFGGGFLYTNKESISLGIVVGIHALMEKPYISAPEMFESFKNRADVAPLIKNGQSVEYSAHVIGEGGYDNLNRLYGNGVLVAGDAAGFGLNGGLIVRGMEYAMASGYYAAQAIISACEAQDFTASTLSNYQKLLEDSFVLKDFKEYKTTPYGLNHDRFFTYYPKMVIDLMDDLFAVHDGPKQRIYPTIRKHIGLKDVLGIVKNDLKKVKKL